MSQPTSVKAPRGRAMLAVLGTAIAVGGVAAHETASAQDYPGKKPIRLIVPFAPGGGTDIVARLVSQRAAEALGTTIVVDNRGGAGGSTAIDMVLRAAPDGYTLIFGAASYATNAALYKLSYDPVNDITPIHLTCLSGYLLSLHPGVPATSTAELIAYAKQRPGALSYGSSGIGGLAHLATELFTSMSGTRMTHVPYKGTGPALTDVLGGQIQVLMGSIPSTTQHVKMNRLRGLSVTTAKRSALVPDIPTIAETVPGYEAVLWYGVWGPKNLPAHVVNRWNKDLDALIQSPDMRERMSKEGVEPAGGSPQQFKTVLARDIAKWTKVARDAKVSVDQ